eukprot:GEMP01038447.1.p1 GENE.GEMP01038447.1~~GEMP01038447.1.p1  ORF type:complete len:382 (+),score=82.20 GEMP01038447.1:133-1278(+)
MVHRPQPTATASSTREWEQQWTGRRPVTKDFNGPVKAPNAYFLWARKVRGEVIEKCTEGDTKLKISTLGRRIAELWKTVDQETKDEYARVAAEQNKTHKLEMKAWKQTEDYARFKQARADYNHHRARRLSTKNDKGRSSNDGASSGSNTSPRNARLSSKNSLVTKNGMKTKRKRMDGMPIKPNSAYLFFLKARRPIEIEAMRAAGEKISFKTVGLRMRGKWENATFEEKQPFLQENDVLKTKYREDINAFMASDYYKARRADAARLRNDSVRRERARKREIVLEKRRIREGRLASMESPPIKVSPVNTAHRISIYEFHHQRDTRVAPHNYGHEQHRFCIEQPSEMPMAQNDVFDDEMEEDIFENVEDMMFATPQILNDPCL